MVTRGERGQWSAGNTPIRMVAWLSGAGALAGLAGVVLFPAAGFAISQWWPAAAMALGCGAAFGFVGLRMNVGATLGSGGLRAFYLLRTSRSWRPEEIAWAFLHRQKTTLMGAVAHDDALNLVSYDGTSIQLTVPARGSGRERALALLDSLPALLPKAYLGFDPEAVRAWRNRETNPKGWQWLVDDQVARRSSLRQGFSNTRKVW